MRVPTPREVVLVSTQYRMSNHHRTVWVTEKSVPYGPFASPKMARKFAEKAARESLRQRWTLGVYGDIRTVGSTIWIVENDSNHRVIVSVDKTRPAHVRVAWASIRAWFGDSPVRPEAGRKAA
jgi:hypothetical protein